jgi:hypothetical protein
MIITSCNLPIESKSTIVNDNFKGIVDSYIESNPIKLVEIWVSEKKLEIPYPAYHIYFDRRQNDTIIFMKLFPSFNNFNPINFEKEGDTLEIYTEIKHNGFFLYDNNPIIIFDMDNYSKNVINKEILINKIPDSLKFNGGPNNHIKSGSHYYKMSKLDFVSVSWEEIYN